MHQQSFNKMVQQFPCIFLSERKKRLSQGDNLVHNRWFRDSEVNLGYEPVDESVMKQEKNFRSNLWRQDSNAVENGFDSPDVIDVTSEQLCTKDVTVSCKSLSKTEEDRRSDQWRRNPDEVDLGYEIMDENLVDKKKNHRSDQLFGRSERMLKQDSMSRPAPTSRGVGRTQERYGFGSNTVVDLRRRRASLGCIFAEDLDRQKTQENLPIQSLQSSRGKDSVCRSSPTFRGISRTVSSHSRRNLHSDLEPRRRASISTFGIVPAADNAPNRFCARHSCISKFSLVKDNIITEDFEEGAEVQGTGHNKHSISRRNSMARSAPSMRGIGRTIEVYNSGSNTIVDPHRRRRASIGTFGRTTNSQLTSMSEMHSCMPQLLRRSAQRRESLSRTVPISRGVERNTAVYSPGNNHLVDSQRTRARSDLGEIVQYKDRIAPPKIESRAKSPTIFAKRRNSVCHIISDSCRVDGTDLRRMHLLRNLSSQLELMSEMHSSMPQLSFHGDALLETKLEEDTFRQVEMERLKKEVHQLKENLAEKENENEKLCIEHDNYKISTEQTIVNLQKQYMDALAEKEKKEISQEQKIQELETQNEMMKKRLYEYSRKEKAAASIFEKEDNIRNPLISEIQMMKKELHKLKGKVLKQENKLCKEYDKFKINTEQTIANIQKHFFSP